MITEQQKNNIHKLSTDDCIEIMKTCIDRIELCSIEEYSSINAIPLRTVYYLLNQGKIKYLEISGHKFPIVNV